MMRLATWVDPASKGSNLQVRWWLGNIPNPREDIDLFMDFDAGLCFSYMYLDMILCKKCIAFWEGRVYEFLRPFTVVVPDSILPLPRYNPDLSGSETGQLTVNEKACLWENLWVKIYEWCKCFAFYMWAFCLCMQHCAWNVCITWNVFMWNWCKTKHNHLNHPQFRHLVISMAWCNWKLQNKVVWPKCTQVESIYIQLN